MTLIALTIGGGFTGVVLSSQYLFNQGGPVYLAVAASFVALYAFVVASGLLFVYDPRRTRLLLVALAVQIPWISTPFVVYKFAAGFYAFLNIGPPREPGRFGVYCGTETLLGSSFRFAWLQKAPSPWTIGVNFVALTLFILLRKSVQRAVPTSEPVDSAPRDSGDPTTAVAS